MRTFVGGVSIDYEKLRKNGVQIVAKLREQGIVRVKDLNGTNLEFDIQGRHVGIEVGVVESCSEGNGCEVEVPSGEVYVAPLGNSANGVLTVDRLKEYGIQGLELRFEKGRITSFKAKKGAMCSGVFWQEPMETRIESRNSV